MAKYNFTSYMKYGSHKGAVKSHPVQFSRLQRSTEPQEERQVPERQSNLSDMDS